MVWILGWSLCTYVEHGRGPWGGRYDPAPITAHHRLLARFVAQLPADAAVTATAAVHPHVSHRRYVYQFPLGLDAPVPAEWALLDVTTNTDMAPGDLKATGGCHAGGRLGRGGCGGRFPAAAPGRAGQGDPARLLLLCAPAAGWRACPGTACACPS